MEQAFGIATNFYEHSKRLNAANYTFDVEALGELVHRVEPRMITIGASLNLTHHPVSAIRELADDVKHQVGTRRTGEQMKGLFLAGVNVAEIALPMVGMEVQGRTNIISQNDDILKTVDEIAIARDAAVYVAPEMRLAGAVVQIILALDTHNKAKNGPAQEPTPVARERAAEQQWQRADNVAAPPAEFNDL